MEGGFEGWAADGRPISMDQIPVPTIDPFKPAFPCCGIFQQSAEVAANPNAPSASLVAATDRMFDRIPDDFGAITAEELEQEISANPSLVVIDLRPTSALAENQPIEAPNFMNIPFEKLIDERELWPKDKSTPVVVYCEDGTVSPIAMTIFWAWGYQNTRELQGGIAAWK
jgi:rhodanese-related sulfurtransferase